MVNALETRGQMEDRSMEGTDSAGREREMVYRSPMVFTFMPMSFTTSTPATTAIREPGIFLETFGHRIRMASPMHPTSSACQFSVPMEAATASSFSMVSMA